MANSRWLVVIPFEGQWFAGVADSSQGLHALAQPLGQEMHMWVPLHVVSRPVPLPELILYPTAEEAFEAAEEAEWFFDADHNPRVGVSPCNLPA